MKHFAKVRLRIEKDVIIRIRRMLQGSGRLNVNVGQIVTPAEIIGSATVSAGFRTVNLSVLLSVPPQDVEKFLVRKLGQRIYKDELLALKKSFLFGTQKAVTSPTDGILDFLNNQTGELKISFLPKRKDLPAGVYGVVEEVDEEKDQVIICIQATRIYGIFGSGKPRDGTLHILGKKDALISRDKIQPKYEGCILVGGSLFFKETITSSISNGVGGLITGGLNAEDYRGMVNGRLAFPRKLDTDIGISIVACEGFGSIPIGFDIFQILSEYEGKFVFIDGNRAVINLPSPTSASLIKVKNTKLPPMQNDDLVSDQEHDREILELKLGLQVRVVGNSYLGEQGKLLAVDDSLTLLPSGIKTYLATVQTTRRKIQVPVANLEVIV